MKYLYEKKQKKLIDIVKKINIKRNSSYEMLTSDVFTDFLKTSLSNVWFISLEFLFIFGFELENKSLINNILNCYLVVLHQRLKKIFSTCQNS